jgi:translation elongation factor EF-G
MVEEAVVMDVKDLSFDIIVCSTGQVQRIYTNVSNPQVQYRENIAVKK